MLARGADGCLCCGSTKLDAQTTLTSLFLSRRAWGGTPVKTLLYRCLDCGFRFYERGLSDDEVRSLYRRYRTGEYQRERQKDEPFYTKRAHARIEESERSDARRQSFESVLARAGIRHAETVLDYGGADGRLIAGLPAGRKAVYDIAGTAAVEGVEALTSESPFSEWDLVVCAQTLEHVSDPLEFVRTLLATTRHGGHLYLEVPIQSWRDRSMPGALRDRVLQFALRYRWFHVALDVYSTAFRIKFAILPPFGIVPMREHLNFFSTAALNALAVRAEGKVLHCGQEDTLGAIVAIVQRS